MQLNLVNFLMGTPPAAASANARPGEEGSADFARLLGDAGAQCGGQSSGGNCNQPAAAAALIAQELDPTQLTALQGAQGDKLVQLLTQLIGPEQARALIAKIDAMGNSGHGHFHQAFDQLKEALENIEAGGEPTDVAGLLENLPAVAEAETPSERAPVLQRMLAWMQSAFDKHKEASQQATAASLMHDAAVQSLQASLFPAGDDAAAATPSQTDDDQADTQTITQIIPLSHSQLTALPEWVHKLTAGEEHIASTAIDEAIPTLTLSQEDTLPEVTLPGAPDAKAKEATHATPAQNFRDQLAALPAQLHDEPTAAQPVSEPASATPAAVAMAPITTHHATTITPLSHASLSHYTPHTMATEQVQMAITTAAKDGIDRITLQLEPAELGRVEIKLEIGAEGRTNISFLVDKADTLDALSRDARSLERALQEAGIRADAGSMQFNLRQQQFNEEFDGEGSSSSAPEDEEAALAPAGGITGHYTINVREGVDIHA